MAENKVGYDREKVFDAYNQAKSDHGAPYCAWSLFKEAYGENAKRDFLAAVDNGDMTVYARKDGIRADGFWPRFNIGRLWLQAEF